MRLILVAALLLVGCAGPSVRLIDHPDRPGAICDARVVDLNRRLCAEKTGATFIEPGAERPCGGCQR